MKLRILSIFFLLGLSLNSWGQSHDLIKVSNTQEFLEALGSDRTIQLAEGRYDFSLFTHMGDSHYFFENVYDGQELVIQNLNNLVIRSQDENKLAELITQPTYGNVIVFKECRNIRLESLIAGHGVEKGNCTGGVVKFNNCYNVELENLELYGSGTEGITGEEVSGLTCEDVTIRSCTYGIMTFENSKDLTFRRSIFRENQEFDLVNLRDCESVRFEDCVFIYNRTDTRFGEASMFNIFGEDKVKLTRCTITGNNTSHMVNNSALIELDAATKTSGNYFFGGKYKE